jgi:hypothetical protein
MEYNKGCYNCMKIREWFFGLAGLYFTIDVVKQRPYATWLGLGLALSIPIISFGASRYFYKKAQEILSLDQ